MDAAVRLASSTMPTGTGWLPAGAEKLYAWDSQWKTLVPEEEGISSDRFTAEPQTNKHEFGR